MKTFVKKFLGFSVGPILGSLVSFITVPLTTFFISPSQMGKASMFTVIQGLVVSFIYLGIDQAYTREYHYEPDEKKLIQNAILVPMSFALIVSVLLIFFSKEFSVWMFESPRYSYVAYLFAVMCVGLVLERFILLLIRMRERSGEYSLFTVSLKVLILLTTVILIFTRKRDFLTIVYSTIIGQLLGDGVLFLRYRHYILPKFSEYDFSLIKRMCMFGFPLIISVSLTNLLNTMDRLFLRGFSTYSELGIYTAALKVAAIVQLVQSAFTTFWVPTAYRWNKEHRDMKVYVFVSQLVLFIFTLFFFGLLFTKKFIVLILSSRYSDAQFVIGLLALTPVLYTISETTTLGIVFSGKSYYNIWVSVIAFVPNIILNFLLIKPFGTVGAAISTATAYLLFFIGRTYFSKKCGFAIPSTNLTINCILLFIAGILSSLRNNYSYILVIVVFLICLISQRGFYYKLYDVIKHPDQWNLD